MSWNYPKCIDLIWNRTESSTVVKIVRYLLPSSIFFCEQANLRFVRNIPRYDITNSKSKTKIHTGEDIGRIFLSFASFSADAFWLGIVLRDCSKTSAKIISIRLESTAISRIKESYFSLRNLQNSNRGGEWFSLSEERWSVSVPGGVGGFSENLSGEHFLLRDLFTRSIWIKYVRKNACSLNFLFGSCMRFPWAMEKKNCRAMENLTMQNKKSHTMPWTATKIWGFQNVPTQRPLTFWCCA